MSDCLYSGNIGQYVYYDAIKFEINLIFLIKPFCYMTKKSRQKVKYLENKKSFLVEIEVAFLIIFKGLLVAENLLRPESAPLKKQIG